MIGNEDWLISYIVVITAGVSLVKEGKKTGEGARSASYW